MNYHYKNNLFGYNNEDISVVLVCQKFLLLFLYARIFIKKYMIPEIEKSKKMKDFIAHVLNVQGDDIENEQIKELQYDYFVCGSDQIWNPYHFDPIYFLYFVSLFSLGNSPNELTPKLGA